MHAARRVTSSLPRADALAQLKDTAQSLKALGLTQAPGRMCAGLKKYGQGWAVYVGYQDSDDVPDQESDADSARHGRIA